MIRVNALSGKEITINAELIEMVENMPETLITLVNGRKLLVKESQEEITELTGIPAAACARRCSV